MIGHPCRACGSCRTEMIGPEIYSDGEVWFRWLCLASFCGATWVTA